MTQTPPPTGHGPVRVDLQTARVSIYATFTYDNDGGGTLPAHAITLRGAQREVTAALQATGYHPVGRWTTNGNRSTRTYRPPTPTINPTPDTPTGGAWDWQQTPPAP